VTEICVGRHRLATVAGYYAAVMLIDCCEKSVQLDKQHKEGRQEVLIRDAARNATVLYSSQSSNSLLKMSEGVRLNNVALFYAVSLIFFKQPNKLCEIFHL
jgi:hypothetical protein